MNIDLKVHRFKANGWNNEQNFGNNRRILKELLERKIKAK